MQKLSRNAVISYARLAAVLLLSLISQRLLVGKLGVERYGVFATINAVGMFGAMLSTMFATGLTRFLGVETGTQDQARLREVYATGFFGFSALSLLFVGFALTLGPQLFRLLDYSPALWSPYVFIVLAAATLIMAGPAACLFHARQRIALALAPQMYSAVAIFIAAVVIDRADYDALSKIAAVVFIVQAGGTVLLLVYCSLSYREARPRLSSLKNQIWRPLLNFSAWNSLGHAVHYLRTSGLLLGLSFVSGPSAAAALELSLKIAALLRQIGHSIVLVIQPMMTMIADRGVSSSLEHLSHTASKFSTFAVMLIGFPVLLCPDLILLCWLGDYPDGTPLFLRILSMSVLISHLTSGHGMVCIAIGKIDFAIGMSSAIQFLILLAGFVLAVVLMPSGPIWVLPVASLAAMSITLIFYVVLVGARIRVTASTWFTMVIVPLIKTTTVGVLVCTTLLAIDVKGWLGLILVLATSTAGLCLGMWFFGLAQTERAELFTRPK